jgi:hypothetical protein
LDQVDWIEYDAFSVLLRSAQWTTGRFPDCRGHSVRDRFEVVTEMANIGTWESELRRNRITGPPQLEAFHDFQPGTRSEWALMSRFRTNQETC